MKPGCNDCRQGKCYHIDQSNALAVQELKDRIEILEEAVNMLEDRINSIMKDQAFEPFFIDYDLSDEDVQKLKDWLRDDKQIYNLPDEFRDIAQGE